MQVRRGRTRASERSPLAPPGHAEAALRRQFLLALRRRSRGLPQKMTWARADAWALRGVIALTALLCTAGVYRILAVLFLHIPLDPNEGWNAYHAASAMGGTPLYPAA